MLINISFSPKSSFITGLWKWFKIWINTILSLMLIVLFLSCNKTKTVALEKSSQAADSLLSPEDSTQAIQNLLNSMIFVEGGTFIPYQSGEQSISPINVKSFYIGKYEVSQLQWRAIMGNNPSNFKACSDCPVERVSWYDVQEFIQILNILTKKHFRLPAEAEWEYAARGGKLSNNYLYSGSNNADDVSYYRKNSRGQTHPAGQKRPNELGIYDMSGNVYEWCNDWFSEIIQNETVSRNSDRVTVKKKYKVLKGGYWNSNPNSLITSTE